MYYVFAFLLWSFCAYSLHRLAHLKSTYNPLFRIHLAHHLTEYGKEDTYAFQWPAWPSYLLWFDDLNSSLDVWITLVLPAAVVSLIIPQTHFSVLGFVYLYEVFLSEHNLDHNPQICGAVTSVLAIGNYHLTHHHYPRYNYGLYLTLWDYVFVTVRPVETGDMSHLFWQSMTRNDLIGF
jgi:sterol desaturase/sphingolipid hydroxylase (fatty acid hydroxylase superfamily)